MKRTAHYLWISSLAIAGAATAVAAEESASTGTKHELGTVLITAQRVARDSRGATNLNGALRSHGRGRIPGKTPAHWWEM